MKLDNMRNEYIESRENGTSFISQALKHLMIGIVMGGCLFAPYPLLILGVGVAAGVLVYKKFEDATDQYGTLLRPSYNVLKEPEVDIEGLGEYLNESEKEQKLKNNLENNLENNLVSIYVNKDKRPIKPTITYNTFARIYPFPSNENNNIEKDSEPML